MDVIGLHHVNINVRDLPEALSFYIDTLGFELLPRPDFGFEGAWIRMGTHELHLVVAPSAVIDRGQHFALQVASADATAAEFDRLGLSYRRGDSLSGPGRQLFVKDPTGNRIEFQQF